MSAGLVATASSAVTAVTSAAYFIVVVGGIGFFLWRASRLIGQPQATARSEIAIAGLASVFLLVMIVGGFLLFGLLSIGDG